MRLVYILSVLVLAVVAATGQRVESRSERFTIVDDVTTRSVSIASQPMVMGSYTLSFYSGPSVQQSLITVPNSGTISWLTPGASNNVLISDGTTVYWANPLSVTPGWLLGGTATTTAWDGLAGAMLGSTTAFPLSLVTRNAAPQSIRFYTGILASLERARVSESGGLMIGTTAPPVNTVLAVAAVASAGRAIDVNLLGSSTSSGILVRSVGNTSTTNGAVVVGSAVNGQGTALRIGTSLAGSDPDVGIEIEAASPLTLLPTTTATGTGTLFGSALLPYRNGLQAYSNTPNGQIGRGVLADASAASSGLGVGMRAHADVTVGDVLPLVVSSMNNADVYLGSSSSDVPAGLSLLSPGAQTSTARMHNARLSGTLTVRGTGTGVTTFIAGDQGAASINYTLPVAGPTASNTVLVAQPSGTLSWADASGLGDVLMEETPTDGDIVRLPSLTTGGGTRTALNVDDYSSNLSGHTGSYVGGRYSGMLSSARSFIEDGTGSVCFSGDTNKIFANNNAVILGGSENMESQNGISAFVGAGVRNYVIGCNYGGAVAGRSNYIIDASNSSFTGGGASYITGSPSSAVLSGNRAILFTSSNSFIGTSERGVRTEGAWMLSSNHSAIVAGNVRIEGSLSAFIGCGYATRISTSANRSAIVAGGGPLFNPTDDDLNIIDLSADAAILGGVGNVTRLSAHRSVTLAGRNTTIEQTQICAFANNTSTQATTLTTANVTAFVNAPFLLASNSGTTSELRLFEGQAATGLFPVPATNYIGIRATSVTPSNSTYALPALPSTSGQMLTLVMVPPFDQLAWSNHSRLWTMSGVDVTSDYASLGPMVASSNGQPLVFATRSGTAQDIRFFGASSGTTEYMRISGTNGGLGIGLAGAAPTRTLDVAGTVRFGSDGTTIQNVIRAVESLDIPNVTSGATYVATISVPNADPSAATRVTPRATLPSGLAIAWARVSATGTVSVAFHNLSGADVDPAAMNFSIFLVQ